MKQNALQFAGFCGFRLKTTNHAIACESRNCQFKSARLVSLIPVFLFRVIQIIDHKIGLVLHFYFMILKLKFNFIFKMELGKIGASRGV